VNPTISLEQYTVQELQLYLTIASERDFPHADGGLRAVHRLVLAVIQALRVFILWATPESFQGPYSITSVEKGLAKSN
jgi:hypothetical protein